MAIDTDDAIRLLHVALRTLGHDFRDLRIAELGDQFVKGFGGRRTLAKHVFAVLGATHESFDINGKGGAHAVDLGQPLGEQCPQFFQGFDLVTNYGTSEHVESGPDAQRWCFANMDWLCCVGGVMVHYVPHVECSRHGAYHYDEGFFVRLAHVAGYQIVTLEKSKKWNRRITDDAQQNDHYVGAVLVKSGRPFNVGDLPMMVRHAQYPRRVEGVR